MTVSLDSRTLGERLRALRKREGFTQGKAAEYIRAHASAISVELTNPVTRSTLASYENDNARPPAVTLWVIATFYRDDYASLSLAGLPGVSR